jgi:hypothetical protein
MELLVLHAGLLHNAKSAPSRSSELMPPEFVSGEVKVRNRNGVPVGFPAGIVRDTAEFEFDMAAALMKVTAPGAPARLPAVVVMLTDEKVLVVAS